MENQQPYSQQTEKSQKSIWKKWWFWVIVIFVIIIVASAGGDEKKEITPIVGEPTTKATTETKVEETIKKSDFAITAEEIYANYLKCQKDFSVEDLLRQKYDGKIVEITGIVDGKKDYYKDTIAAKNGVDVSEFIDENKRYEICLADNQGHSCLSYVYSSNPQLIDKIKQGDKISVIGQWENSSGSCGIPNLINSEILTNK